eukprot:9171437-Pyramimonas_sp.AAC.1
MGAPLLSAARGPGRGRHPPGPGPGGWATLRPGGGGGLFRRRRGREVEEGFVGSLGLARLGMLTSFGPTRHLGVGGKKTRGVRVCVCVVCCVLCVVCCVLCCVAGSPCPKMGFLFPKS